MNNKEKAFTGVAVVGAFLLGYFLTRCKAPEGSVEVSFNPEGTVLYDVVDAGGDEFIPWTYVPRSEILPPGSYTVNMNPAAGMF